VGFEILEIASGASLPWHVLHRTQVYAHRRYETNVSSKEKAVVLSEEDFEGKESRAIHENNVIFLF
jgi:hypothetical protein